MTSDGYEYIRSTYMVPAYIGVRVSHDSLGGGALIKPKVGHYLRVRLDRHDDIVNLHPRDTGVVYHFRPSTVFA